MVGIVLVSHSRPLALAVQEMVRSVAGEGIPLAIAAGSGDDHSLLGTNAVEIQAAIESVMGAEGVLVLADMGSAVLSSETALALLDDALRARVLISSAPLVEGAVSAGVAALLGNSLAEVAGEARRALDAKSRQLAEEGEGDPTPPAAPPPEAPLPATARSIELRIDLPHGLHARPAARLVREAGRFDCEVRVANATTGRGPVAARSMSALAGLEVLQGQTLRVTAAGPQAEAALQALQRLAEDRFGEAPSDLPPPAAAPGAPPPSSTQGAQPVVGGVALGPALYLADRWPALPDDPAADPAVERRRLAEALRHVRAQLEGDRERAKAVFGAGHAGIFDAHLALLADPALEAAAGEGIVRDGLSAPRAWERAARALVSQYQDFADPYLRERAADVGEIGKRVLAAMGFSASASLSPEAEGILVVDDLTPAQAAQLEAARISGVVCLDGGATSHGAILLRALGIPAVAQARRFLPGGVAEGVEIGFDGATGEIWIAPDAEQRARLAARRDDEVSRRQGEAAEAGRPAVTRDGHAVEILANIGHARDTRAALDNGAEGIGLLRTEFLFLDRPREPDEEEQVESLRVLLAGMEGKPVVVRTLDAGGDKELPYLGLPPEANPFLGVRALRVSFARPPLFQTQLRALLRAGVGFDLRILFPMVADLSDLRRARAALAEAHESLRRENRPHLWPVPSGIMVEIPSSAILVEGLAAEADFLSIGTNDLTQYTLAADRGNPALAAFQDALHPAVLALVARVVEAAHARGKKVAVCGEAAGDPTAALVLAGLGVDELSMTPAAIPRLKHALRSASYPDLQAAALRCLREPSAETARACLATPC